MRERIGNTEAERYLLGMALIESAVLDEAATKLKPLDFVLDAHRRTFEALLSMRDAGVPIEGVALAEQLERRGDLERVGGVAFVASLSDGAVSIDPGHYVELVRGYAYRRRTAQNAAHLHRIALDPEATLEDVATARESLDDAEPLGAKSLQPLGEVVGTRLREIERLADAEPGAAAGFKTGLLDLDRLTTGIRPGELWVVGAIPGSGKTALMGQIAHVNAYDGVGVGVMSLEMSASALADRFAALSTGIHLRKFREPRLLTATERANLIEARDVLGSLPVVIDDTPGLALAEIRARARLMMRRADVGLILVDYLQLVTGPGEVRREQVAAVARGLKNLARELGVGVVAASQLSRPQKGAEHKPPTMLDLKESGEIEAAADVVLLIHRPFVLTQKLDDRGEDRFIIGKNRHGTIGSVDVVFEDTRCRFLPAARRVE